MAIVDIKHTQAIVDIKHSQTIEEMLRDEGGFATGTINIDQNGTYDVAQYAEANVAVPEPTGTIDITQNGEVDVTEYATANVAVPGQSAIKLLATENIGTVSVTTTTTATSLDKTVSVPHVDAYDMLIVVATAATNANSKNLETVSVVFLTGTNNMSSKSNTSTATVKWNEYMATVARSSTITNAAGVFPMSPTVSSGTASLPMYARADSSAGTINDTYTVRVFGVILETFSGNGIVSQITQ